MSGAIDRCYDAQDALLALIDAATAFDAPIELGPPLQMKRDHAWVSTNLDASLEPHESNLSTFDIDSSIGLGIAVTREGEAWSVLRERAITLAGAAETAVRASVTLSGTCSYAYLSQVESREIMVTERKKRIQVIMVWTVRHHLT